jgi:tetratricopeptide (TPR) repeat protein
MIAVARTKYSELIERLNQLVRSAGGRKVDELALRRIEKEARDLLNADKPGAYVVLGAVACVKHDYASMHANHKRAIQLGGGAFACMQYSISLNIVGMFAESLEYAERAHEIDPMDSMMIENVIGALLQIGLSHRAKEYAAKWRKLNPEKDEYISDEEIDNFPGSIRPLVKDATDKVLTKYKDVWSALAKH